MIQHAKRNERCRSRLLLEYFGDKSSHDCGQCDVCLDAQGKTVTREGLKTAREQIQSLLADRQRHHITEFLRLKLPTEEIDAALTELVQQELVTMDDGLIFQK
jgi:ATP-dependent DNA helicase RecQ